MVVIHIIVNSFYNILPTIILNVNNIDKKKTVEILISTFLLK